MRKPVPGAVESPAAAPVFVGRERELSLLEQAFERARGGTPSILFLTGEPGIGKTRTIEELTARLRRRKLVLWWGRCLEVESAIPYGAWASALRSYLRAAGPEALASRIGSRSADLARLLPELACAGVALGGAAPLSSASARRRLFEAVTALVRSLSEERVLLIVLDDLHWADPSSIRLLEHLMGELTDDRVLVVGTYREAELDHQPLLPTIGELVKLSGFRHARLAGLTREEVRRYLHAATGSDPRPSLVRDVFERTDGNPLFVVELARAVPDLTPPNRGKVDVTEGIRAVVARNLRRLPPPCEELLEAASVVGTAFDLRILADTVGRDEESVRRALERSLSSGLVVEDRESNRPYRFAHALIQEALLAGLNASRTAELHAKAARAIESRYGAEAGPHSGEVARHLAAAAGRAGEADFSRLTDTAVRAAEYAYRCGAPEQAFAVLRDTRRIGERRPPGSDPAALARLCHAEARLLYDGGDPKALELITRSFDLYEGINDIAGAVRVALTPAQSVTRVGTFESTVPLFTGAATLRRRALALVPPGSREEAQLLAQENGTAPERALPVARSCGDEQLEMWALAHVAVHYIATGDFERADAAHERALALAGKHRDWHAAFYCVYWARYRYAITGETAEVLRLGENLLDVAEATRSTTRLSTAHMCLAASAFPTGEWETCRHHAERVLELSPPSEELYARTIALCILALIEAESGRPEGAEEYLVTLGRVSKTPKTPAPFLLPDLARASGNLGLLDGVATALGATKSAGTPCGWSECVAQVTLAATAAMKGDRTAMPELYRYFLPLKGRFLPGGALGKSVDGLLARLSAGLGNLEQAVQHAGEAARFCREAGYRPELAWNLRYFAEFLVRRNAPEDLARAVELLGEAEEVGSSLGLVPLLRQVRDARKSCESAGASARRHFPCGLTAREVDVLRLAARGFTNREIGQRLFISALTVATHMQNILAKTGMSNRAEAVAFASREGLLD